MSKKAGTYRMQGMAALLKRAAIPCILKIFSHFIPKFTGTQWSCQNNGLVKGQARKQTPQKNF
ncbi:hypothetical protein KSC_097680 [Ktedonobacter sp. SOSP1-52]|nr:hypothetical protein KSC_097680 [Ktedonobacter sp. SOSP1-52]